MYTAKELSEKLINEGFSDMSVRKINYYAFEKKMFPVSGTGKSVFSEDDYDKLKSIAFLRENSKLSLEDIKEKIKNNSFQDIDNSNLNKTIDEYTSRNLQSTSFVANNICCLDNFEEKTLPSFTTSACSNTVSTESYSLNSTVYSNSSSPNQSISSTYTGTPPDFFRSMSTSSATQTQTGEIETIEDNNRKTRVRIAKGIVIEYEQSADKEKVNKLIDISKILFE